MCSRFKLAGKNSSKGSNTREGGHVAEVPRPAMASRCRTNLASERTREGDGAVATLSAWRWDGEQGELGGARGSLPTTTMERDGGARGILQQQARLSGVRAAPTGHRVLLYFVPCWTRSACRRPLLF